MHTPTGLLVYTPKLTPRVKYAFRLVLSTCLGVPVSFTEKKAEAAHAQMPVINYSAGDLPGALQVVPCGLLHETGVQPQQPGVEEWKGLPVFYKTSPASPLPFDLFSAAFFMATRYEEYLPFEPDMHGRFRAEDSFAHRKGFLQKPVIHLWARELKNILLEKHPGFSFPGARYRFFPTMDVDVAMAYRFRGGLRTIGGLLRDLFSGHFGEVAARLKTLSGWQKDPFDIYGETETLHLAHELNSVYFFSLGDRGPFDHNLSHRNRQYRKWVGRMSCPNKTGLHPSYDTMKNREKLLEEKERLETITRRKVTASRQHYLRVSFPETYQNLIAAGIEKDFSMGFASLPGFRAGMCFPFKFYDLSREKETTLEIWPFQVMDGTLNTYMQLTPEQAVEEITKLVQSVREVNGMFVSLWHNHALSEKKEWKGWKKVYEELVKLAAG